MQINTLTPLEQTDIKLTLLNRLNDVFTHVHPEWSLSTDDIREVLLLYLSITTNERWCLSKIVSHTRRSKEVTGVTGTQPLTAHLHSGVNSPCPAEEALQ